jgi:outer membrane receptor protein involved in Fe transport
MDDGKVSFEGALFTTHWNDIQIQTSAGGFNFFVNGGTATSQGAEATLLFYPVDAWSIRATAAYTDAKLTSNAPLAGGANGDELPFVPKVTGSLSSTYHWPLAAGWDASVGGSVNYTGNRRSDYSLRAPVTVPSYTTVNLDAAISREAWTFSVYVKNLGNSKGITYLETRGLLPGDNPTTAGIITPLTIGVQANYRF